MKISVTENKLIIQQDQILNENEYNIHKIEFDFSSEYTDDLVKVALFTKDNLTYKKIISNNECDIPPEILQKTGYSILGVYAYKTEQDTLVLRYSPTPTKISVFDGSYKAEAENSEPITPSEIEQYQQILQNSLQQFQNQYNALVEETEGDIQEIEDELQRKVDEGYFDGEDGFSPIAKVIQKSNGATIEIEDKNGKTTADIYNGADGKDGKDGQDGQDGYTPQRGIDYWTEEDKEEIKEETIAEIDDKIEEYNTNAAQKVQQYNSNATQKTTDYNTNASQKLETYNQNHTTKLNEYNVNDTEKTSAYNSNAETKTTAYNENAASKLSEYNENHTTKLGQYNTNATEKTNTFNTNATNKLNAYNTNAEQKITAYNQNANEKTQEFDEHTEQIQNDIEILQRTDDEILSNFNKFEEVTGEDITLNETTEIKFAKPPLPMGNSEQESTEGYNLLNLNNLTQKTFRGITYTPVFKENGTLDYIDVNGTADNYSLLSLATGLNLSAGNYRLTGCPAGGSSSTFMFYAVTGQSADTGNGSNISLSEDTQLTDNEIRITILNNTTVNHQKWYPMLISGTQEKDYEPYTGGEASPNPDYPQEITNVTGDVEVKVQNKNRCKSIYETEDLRRFYRALYVDFDIKPNTQYVFSFKTNQNGLAFYPNENIFTNSSAITVSSSDRNIFIGTTKNLENLSSTDHTSNGYAILKNNINLSVAATFEDVQIEENTVATDYVEHKEQVFTFPLGNEKLMLGDYLADDGIHHVRGQAVFNGSEPWYIGAYAPANSVQFLTSKPNNFFIETGTEGLAKIKSSHFINQDTVNGMRIGSSISFFPSNSYNITTVEDFKTWLSTHNVIVEYELEEEIIVPYTSAQQEVYNQIKQSLSYEEQTNIIGSSNGSNPIFTVQAYKSLNKELNNKVDEEELTDYVKNTDYARSDEGGTIKISNATAIGVSVKGVLYATINSFASYNALSNNAFIGKGTLENVIEGKQLINQTQLEESQETQDEEIEKLQEENARFKATLPTTTGEGQAITLNKTAELEFKKPPLPMGNSEQVQYSGKNLFNKKASHFDGDYASFTELETGVRMTATSSGSGNYIWTRFVIKDLSDYVGKTVRCKASIKASANNTPNITIGLCASNGENRTQKASTRTSGELFSFEVPQFSDENTYLYIVFYANAGGSVTSGDYVDYTDVILTIDNSDMAYEPYVGETTSPNPDYPQEITNVTGDVEVVVQNKNLLNDLQQGGINLGSAGELSIASNRVRTNFIQVSPNTTYCISNNNTIVNQFGIGFYDKNYNFISGLSNGAWIGFPYNITPISNAKFIRVVLRNSNNQDITPNLDYEVQLEKGSTATEYVEHKEQVLPLTLGNIELCKIGDYQDYFYKESNKWYLHKEIGKVVLDGVNYKCSYMFTNGSFFVYDTNNNQTLRNAVKSNNNINIISNYLISKTYAEVFNNGNIGVSSSSSLGELVVNIGVTSSKEDINSWFSTHNTSLYYPLETPTDTEITNTTLISQLETINNAISYEEQTNISGSSDGSNPIFNVEVYQDTKLVLEEMATAIVALGGV